MTDHDDTEALAEALHGDADLGPGWAPDYNVAEDVSPFKQLPVLYRCVECREPITALASLTVMRQGQPRRGVCAACASQSITHLTLDIELGIRSFTQALRTAATVATALRRLIQQMHTQQHHRREDLARSAMHAAYDRRRRARRRRSR